MSLTVDTIDTRSAGFAPINMKVVSTRQKSQTGTISAIADSSGKVKLTVSANTNIEDNDCVTIAGATGDFAYLNGRWQVLGKSGTNPYYIEIDCTFASASTGDKGSYTRTNGAVKIKVQTDCTGDIDATFYIYPVYDGADYSVTVDLSPFIQPHFSSDFTLTPGITSDSGVGGAVEFDVNVYEMHQKADYTYYTSAADTTNLNKWAFRTVDYSGRVVNLTSPNNQFLTDQKTQLYRAGDIIILRGICTAAEGYVRLWKSNTVDVTFTKIADFKDDMFLIVHDTTANNGATLKFRVQLEGSDESITWQSEEITFTADRRCYKYPKLLYFLNRYGGWDIYNFREINEDRLTAEKIQTRNFQTVQNTKRQLKLVGRPETYASMAILSDMITSPEVYDSTGAQVRIKESEIVMRKGEDIIIPEITIEYYENEFIY